MAPRVTRSSNVKSSGLAVPHHDQPVKPKVTDKVPKAKTDMKAINQTSSETSGASGVVKDESDQEDAAEPVPISSKKRKRGAAVKNEDEKEWVELPHNMGRVRRNLSGADSSIVADRSVSAAKATIVKAEEVNGSEGDHSSATKRRKKASSKSQDGLKAADSAALKTKSKTGPNLGKKAKAPKKSNYGIMENETPFPEYARPTPEECHAVFEALRKAHPDCHPRPKTIPEPSKTVAGCGEVRAVLDATIRTVLSAATTSANAGKAYAGMYKRFGECTVGNGKGSTDYNAVRAASVGELEEALKQGGLSVRKAKSIKSILDTVYDWNQVRLKELLDAKAKGPEAFATVGTPHESVEMKEAEIQLAQQGILSLDRIYSWPTYEAIHKLTELHGVGAKTAACVALFCMQRSCFAVDTHVFRLSQWLGWVPEQYGKKKPNRDTTFSHLEVRIPDELKYDLHQLFISHGKKCPRCRAATGETSDGWEKGCAIDHLLKRTGVRKEGGSPVKKAVGKGVKGLKGKKKNDMSDDEDENVSMPDLDDEDDEKMEVVMSDADPAPEIVTKAVKSSKAKAAKKTTTVAPKAEKAARKSTTAASQPNVAATKKGRGTKAT